MPNGSTSGPAAPNGGRRRRVPGLVVALAALAVLAAAVAVLTPRGAASGTPLASDGASPTGALALYQTLARLGWRPVRRTTPLDRTGADAVYVAVQAAHGVDERAAGEVLAAVRRGAGLVVDVRPEDPLSDSLGLKLTEGGGRPRGIDNRAAAAALGASDALRRPGCRDGGGVSGAVDVGAGTRYARFSLADSGAAAEGAGGRRVLLDVPPVRGDSFVVGRGGTRLGGRAPVVVGFPYGRGRVVAVADASVLTNSALRACWAVAGVVAVRAFQYASEGVGANGGRPRVVFFEGVRDPDVGPRQPSVLRAVRRALTEVPAGRMVAQWALAALVLLAASGVRALPPVPAGRVARRSPLEQVGALARAYREVRASRTAARRLAAGLRRRYGGAFAGAAFDNGPGAAAGDPDARFLAGVGARYPACAADAARLAAGMTEAVKPGEVVALGEAATRVAGVLEAARGGASRLL